MAQQVVSGSNKSGQVLATVQNAAAGLNQAKDQGQASFISETNNNNSLSTSTFTTATSHEPEPHTKSSKVVEKSGRKSSVASDSRTTTTAAREGQENGAIEVIVVDSNDESTSSKLTNAGQSLAAAGKVAATGACYQQVEVEDEEEEVVGVGRLSLAAAAAAAAAVECNESSGLANGDGQESLTRHAAAGGALSTTSAVKTSTTNAFGDKLAHSKQPATQQQHTVIECGQVVADQVENDNRQQVESTGKPLNSSIVASVDKCSAPIALLPISSQSTITQSRLEERVDSSESTTQQQNNLAEREQEEIETKCNNFHNNHKSDTKSSLSSSTSANNESSQSSLVQNHQHQIVKNHNNSSKHQNSSSPSRDSRKLKPEEFCKRRRLSYLQSLLLRKWPCLAISICIMSSLLFGMLLSALTVYLMHGVTDCSSLAIAAAAANSPLMTTHELLRRPTDFDTPLELASLTSASAASELAGGGNSNGGVAGGSGRHHYSAQMNSAVLSSMEHQSGGSGNGQERPQFQRLPSSVWPIHYDLFVQPYIAEPFNFSGKVSIKIKCSQRTDNITLHTLDLELNEKSLSLKLAPTTTNSSSPASQTATGGGGQRSGAEANKVAPKVKGLSQNKHLQYSIIQLDSPMEAGQEYALGIDFSGSLNDDLAGFYKIKYERQNSTETTWIAATQFQATDARRAFPCFDEPLYKATFSIQIKHWKNMTALSNMPIIDRQDSPDGLWVTDTFSKSHRMSTYLVAYAVTNFESRSEGNISVWTRPGFAHTAEYALKIAGKILRHYEDFFGIEYPLPKMDMIALPDFNAGAMENWGLITYRETAMLYDEMSSSIANKQRVAVVVAHELAHQWFGNLVTPKWWDDLWLNEGFASYVEYIGVDHVEPMWRMLDQFVVEEVQNVFKVDGLSSSHQISIPVNNPDEISEIFDHISYAKGASIIRMMNHFLTEDVFKAGLRRYLRALRYSNAEQSDLWAHLTEAQRTAAATGKVPAQMAVNVERVMNSWTLQTGYPLVTLIRKYDGSHTAKLEQFRYQPYKSQQSNNTNNNNATASKTTMTVGTNSSSSTHHLTTTSNKSSSSPNAQKWEIPITYTWKSDQNWEPKTRLWMHQDDSGPVELNSSMVPKSDDEWMLLNVNQVGYYRVNYDQRNWKLLIDQLNSDHKQITNTNRAQILDDIFELARSGVINYRFALEATKYLRSERDYLPWDTVLMAFSYIDDMLQRTPIYGAWKDYIADLIAPYYARYKDSEWTIRGKINTTTDEQNDVLEQYNQVNAIAWACQVDEHCIQKAKSIFLGWKQSGKNQINPALRYTTYCTAIENGNKDDWNFLWKAYEKEQNASERDRIMRALGCSKEIWILSRYLEWTFSKAKPIRRQDGAFVFRMIAKNNYGRDIAFNFMRERWSTIKEYYGKSSFSLGSLIRSVSTSMNTQIELNQLLTFYETIKGDVGTGKRAFQIAIEEVESNVSWRNRNYRILEDWIQEARGEISVTSIAAH